MTDGEDPERELAARRKDLEREFDAKVRDLKAQADRRAERLREDQADWEEKRRVQAKDLADRAEKIRRQEGNVQARTVQAETTRSDLGALKKQVAALEEARTVAVATHGDLERQIAAGRKGFRAAHGLLTGFGMLAVVGPLVWLVQSGDSASDNSPLLPTVALGLGIFLNLLRLRLASKAR